MIICSIRKISQPMGTANIPMNHEISFFALRCNEYDVSSVITATHLQSSHPELSALSPS